jgi:hypothetical protein
MDAPSPRLRPDNASIRENSWLVFKNRDAREISRTRTIDGSVVRIRRLVDCVAFAVDGNLSHDTVQLRMSKRGHREVDHIAGFGVGGSFMHPSDVFGHFNDELVFLGVAFEEHVDLVAAHRSIERTHVFNGNISNS